MVSDFKDGFAHGIKNTPWIASKSVARHHAYTHAHLTFKIRWQPEVSVWPRTWELWGNFFCQLHHDPITLYFQYRANGGTKIAVANRETEIAVACIFLCCAWMLSSCGKSQVITSWQRQLVHWSEVDYGHKLECRRIRVCTLLLQWLFSSVRPK